MITLSAASTSPTSDGSADHNRASAPTICGPAIDVPLIYVYPPPRWLERTLNPGALTSGLSRPEPSTVTGPRLLKLAMVSLLVVAPMENAAS